MINLIKRIFGKKGRLTFEEVEPFFEKFGINSIFLEEDFKGIEFPRAYCFHMEFSEINAKLIKDQKLNKTYINISGIYHAYSSSANPYSPNFPPQNPRFYRKYPFNIVNGKLNLKRK